MEGEMSKLEGPGLIFEALSFAVHHHVRRSAKGKPSLVADPIELAHILAVEGGISDDTTLAAAVLHGVLDGTKTKPADLASAFGKKVASIVSETANQNGVANGPSKKNGGKNGAKLSKRAQL